MEIRRIKVDASFEKMMAIGMVTSTKALQEILSICNVDMLNGSSAGKWIFNTCKAYYEKYEQAPNKHIQDIFDQEVREGGLEDSTIKYLEKVLAGLSDKYEQEDFNIDFM